MGVASGSGCCKGNFGVFRTATPGVYVECEQLQLGTDSTWKCKVGKFGRETNSLYEKGIKNFLWNQQSCSVCIIIKGLGVLGVRPAETDDGEPVISPCAGKFRWAKGEVPTSHGLVKTQWR